MNSCIETLNQSGGNFLNFAGPMLWQSSLLMVILFTVDFLFRRKIRASIRYAFWLVVLVKLCLPPTLALPTGAAWWLFPSKAAGQAPLSTKYVVSYDTTAPTDSLQPNFPTPAPPPPKLNVAGWALLGSGFVSVGLLLWLAVRWWQISRKVSCALTSERLAALLDEIRGCAGLRSPLRLRLVDGQMSPAVCGLLRPVILLPRVLAEQLSPEQLRAVLLHEAFHLRRKDVWVNCAQALLQIIYWWHPLLWLANARIRRLREEAVDDAVMLALRDEAETYAPTLVEVAKLAFSRPLMSLGLVGIMESRSALRQRIERLVNFTAPRKAGVTFLSLGGILLFSAVALPMGQASSREEEVLPAASGTPVITDSATTNVVTKTYRIYHPLDSDNLKQLLLEAGVRTPSGAFFYKDNGILLVHGSMEQQALVYRVVLKLNGFSTNVIETGENLKQAISSVSVATNLTGRNNINGEELKAGKSVQDAKLLYEMGKLDEAETKLRAALSLNPDNAAARYYLNLVQAAKGAPRTGMLQTQSRRKAILDKLNRIRFDQVVYDKLPLSEVIRQLSHQTRSRDPEKKGINFYINSNPGNSAAVNPATGLPEAPKPVADAASQLDQVVINVNLTHVRLAEVLDAIVKASNHPIKYSIVDYGVEFSPKGDQSATLFTRSFKIDPNTLLAGLRQQTQLPGTDSQDVTKALKKLISDAGVDLQPTNKAIFYNDRTGMIFVRATGKDFDTIEQLIQALNYTAPQIHIKARFWEVPKQGFVFSLPGTNVSAGQATGILSDPQMRTVENLLEAKPGFKTLAEPEVVTTSGRQVRMMATTLVSVVTNFAFSESASNVAVFPEQGQVEIGPSLDTVATVLPDGYTIDLRTTASVTNFMGYDQPTNTIPAVTRTGEKFSLPAVLPRLRVRQTSTHLRMWDNQTIVLGNLPAKTTVNGRDVGANPDEQDKSLVVFITVTLVDPAGNRVHSDDEMPFARTGVPPQE